MLNCTALAEDIQLCMVKPPPVCHKFFLFNWRGTALVLYVGMVKNYHGVNKNVLSYFVLCQVRVDGVSLPGVKDYKQERRFCGMQQKKEGI